MKHFSIIAEEMLWSGSFDLNSSWSTDIQAINLDRDGSSNWEVIRGSKNKNIFKKRKIEDGKFFIFFLFNK
jgi:hypothetical protein